MKSVCTYILLAVISWFLASGWVFASLYADNCEYYNRNVLSVREDSGFAAGWSVLAAALWPVFVPVIYLYTGYAEHGWRAVWNLKVTCK